MERGKEKGEGGGRNVKRQKDRQRETCRERERGGGGGGENKMFKQITCTSFQVFWNCPRVFNVAISLSQ